MASCLLVDAGALSVSPVTEIDSCGGYILQTAAEYKAYQSPFADFDIDVFTLVTSFLLITVITGITSGLILRKMR